MSSIDKDIHACLALQLTQKYGFTVSSRIKTVNRFSASSLSMLRGDVLRTLQKLHAWYAVATHMALANLVGSY